MDLELSELRRALSDTGPRGPGRRIPALLRTRLVAVVRRRRAAGESVQDLADALGLASETLRRWLATAPAAFGAPKGPLPVSIVELPTSTVSLALVTPTGFRIEGLTVATAAELLGRLR